LVKLAGGVVEGVAQYRLGNVRLDFKNDQGAVKRSLRVLVIWLNPAIQK
jgi:hypothetical protein